jgi:hypothetical protein
MVVMAAGRGARFGGPKQLEPVGPSGETLIDYTLYDAARAGFDRAVLVMRGEHRTAMARILGRHRGRLRIDTAEQPANPDVPRGTVAAVLAAAASIAGPWAALNADDFYGAAAFRHAADFLRETGQPPDLHAVVWFPLDRTLSAPGSVVRAVGEVHGARRVRLEDVSGIERRGEAVEAGGRRFSGRERVSMNFWAFQAGMLAHLARAFETFAEAHDARHELLLPVAVDALVAGGLAHVRVLNAPGPWLGLTHASDLPAVRSALRELTERGEYPTPLAP